MFASEFVAAVAVGGRVLVAFASPGVGGAVSGMHDVEESGRWVLQTVGCEHAFHDGSDL